MNDSGWNKSSEEYKIDVINLVAGKIMSDDYWKLYHVLDDLIERARDEGAKDENRRTAI